MMSRSGLPTIVASCKQTRFHFQEGKGSGDVDIQGLDLIVKSSPVVEVESPNSATKEKPKPRVKSKAKSEGTEILSNADLRLRAGVRYGLVGRNGTGKSTLLHAMAQKLIPGLPESLRISILQQKDNFDDFSEPSSTATLSLPEQSENVSEGRERKTVLQTVLHSDVSRNEITRKIKILSHALEAQENHLEPVRAIRQLRHEQVKREVFLAEKNASLKSGTRGLQARKDLKTAEAKLVKSMAQQRENLEELPSSKIQEETQAAVDLLNELQAQFDAMNVVDVEQEARKVLKGLGFRETQFDEPFESLSGGWRMRCMLAGVLIQTADIMILDEPTNFLDLLGVIWLETYLTQSVNETGKTVVLVSHDRSFLNNVCEEIVILKDQSLKYFKGNISAYEEDLRAQRLYWGRMKEAQERQIAHMEASIRENIKQGKKTGDDNKLRMAKSRQKKVDERMGVQVSARGGRFKLSRDRIGWHDSLRAEIEVPQEEKGVSVVIPDASDLRFPGPLISMESLTFKYKLRAAPVLNDVELVIHMGDRVGIMGLNGCGKTTLLRVLVGSLEPPQGKVSRHPRLKLGYYSQHSVEELHETGRSAPGLTALALMLRETEGNLDEGEVRGLLGSLGLPGRTASDIPVTQLSGGQLVRLALARLLWKRPHLLVLDEVTTHLDFHTVLGLAAALSTFNGAILLVSHDRYLVRSVIEGKQDTHVAPAEGDIGAELETADDEDEECARRRTVYVLKDGRLQAQENGVEQFEASLERRVRKLMAG
ncbi:hypothetical protein VTO42DRAFT_5936 [Malbranchea cinnamomea]